ncbi:MAG: NAD-dependent malic enzyme [Planctomycetes bacterium]|nr:NAD-dependent malic enzyme [Planctomycetota bacterium]
MHARQQTPVRKQDPRTGETYLEVADCGHRLLSSPLLNKGTAFTLAEREELGLMGLLPPHPRSIELQVEHIMADNRSRPDDLERYIHLMALLDRNETLFYRSVLDNVEELLPIVYTPTVGHACQRFNRIFRRGRGLYISDVELGRVDRVLENWPVEEVDLIVVTDGERILGLGDLGANGMGITIGKLALYIVGAGVSPWKVLPVCLDVGTNNQQLLEDPMYLGLTKARERGERYDALVEEFMMAVKKRWPDCLVQFEDFANLNSFRLLDRYRERVLCFNDDIQGTGSVVYAGIVASERLTGTSVRDHRVVMVGGGSAGIGISRQIVAGMVEAGLDEKTARERIWMLDSKGLITTSRPQLRRTEKLEFARTDESIPMFTPLLEVIRAIKPTILIGGSGQPGLFSEEVIRAAAEGVERPLVFALSNPTSKSECRPKDVYSWTDGRALCAVGSPFPSFEYEGRSIVPGQGNNFYIFPGAGIGALAARARWLPDTVFLAAAEALAALVPDEAFARGTLYPSLREIRRVSREVALATGRAVMKEGLSPLESDAELVRRLDAMIWEPEYLPYRLKAR